MARRGLLVGLAFFAACKGDDGVKVLHNPPTVTITAPADQSNVYDGQTVDYQALVATDDATADMADYSARWVTGTTTMCDGAPVNVDGTSDCSYALTGTGDQSVTVTVTAPDRETGTATITLHVLENSPPTIEITNPVDDEAFEPGELVVFDATVNDVEDNEDQLIVSASADGQDLGFSSSPSSDGSWSEGLSTLGDGAHLVVFKVTDTSGRTGQDTVTVNINGRPGAPTVHIDPDPSESGLELTAIIDTPATDPEGDNLTYNYEWLRDGTSYQSSTNPSVAQGVTVRDDYWEVRVKAFDGFGYGPEASASITIDNSPPSINSVTYNPTSASTDDDVIAVPQGWFDQDGDAPQYLYSWTKNNVLDLAETTDTYPNGKTTRGDQLQVTVTPYDPFAAGEAVTAPTITIGDAAPTTPGVSVTPLAPQPEDDLTCSVSVPSTDLDGDPITYYYSWLKNGVATAITTYQVDDQYTSDGDLWECDVIASDGMSSSAAGIAQVDVEDTIAPAAPSLENPTQYRNETTADLGGDCEAGCSLLFTCQDASNTFTETDTCAGDGTFDHTLASLTRGDITSCSATCTDPAGNTSGPSNTVSTEVCDNPDPYEDDQGYGDTISTNIDLWGQIADDATTTITIAGNALTYGDEDWYLVTSKDPNARNLSASENDYNVHIQITQGASDYEMQVLKAHPVSSPLPTTPECPTALDGYTEYNDYFDAGGGSLACKGTGDDTLSVAGFVNCTDMSSDYYIVVRHDPSVSLSCRPYEITITNGVW